MTVAVAELEQTPENYIFVDDIPEAYAERQIVRQAAEQLLESRRQAAAGNSIEYEPVDALSTAAYVLEAENHYGEESPEYAKKWDALLLDCQRLVGEWYRKNTSEYFEPVRRTYNPGTGAYSFNGLSIRRMTENAIVPIAEDPEEEQRRINERVEDETPHILRSLGSVALGRGIVTFSECTDSAIQSYKADMAAGRPHRGYRGYVPEIEKAVLRHIAVDPLTGDRFETQLTFAGTNHTHEVLQGFLKLKGLVDVEHMGKTELHGAQILVDEEPLEVMRQLDEYSGEQWATNIFMGEEVPDDFVKDYEKFKREALERKESMKGWSQTVALFVLDLARENFDRKKAPEHVENFVKNMLLNIAKKDESVAVQMFDEKTADGLKQVAYLEAQGRYEEANQLWQKVEQEAPGGGSCGGGSCGLESVETGSKEDKELRKKLGASDGDTIVKDKERSCKCGSKSIVYAYNENKVIKYCDACGAREKKISKAA